MRVGVGWGLDFFGAGVRGFSLWCEYHLFPAGTFSILQARLRSDLLSKKNKTCGVIRSLPVGGTHNVVRVPPQYWR